ncbi:hypothetical protein ACTA71_009275 [Dictyostelium dimigraforme]
MNYMNNNNSSNSTIPNAVNTNISYTGPIAKIDDIDNEENEEVEKLNPQKREYPNFCFDYDSDDDEIIMKIKRPNKRGCTPGIIPYDVLFEICINSYHKPPNILLNQPPSICDEEENDQNLLQNFNSTQSCPFTIHSKFLHGSDLYGSTNSAADGLSRSYSSAQVFQVQLRNRGNMDFSNITDIFRDSFFKHGEYNTGIILNEKKLVKRIAVGYGDEQELIKSKSIADQYANLQVQIQNGLKWIKVDDQLKIVVPQIDKIINQVISTYHDSALAGHWSAVKTGELIKRNFYWYGMGKDISDYCSKCKVCLSATDSHKKTMGLYQPTTVPARCFAEITITK